MSLKSGFFNSVNHDRKYDAEDFARLINALVTDGIVTTKGEQFMTVPGQGLSVNVKSGFAWFNSTWSMSEDITSLALDPADVTRARFDAIVIDIDHRNEYRNNKLMVVKGVPSSSPVKPTLINDEKHHQHAIAYVNVPAGATSLTAANIDIRVGHDDCPFATGKLEVISVDTLFDAWEAEFQTWFDNLKAQLGDNVVANLQNQINNISYKITETFHVSTTWIVPSNLASRNIEVTLVGGGGGGGGGGASAYTGGTGGTSSFGTYLSATGGGGGGGGLNPTGGVSTGGTGGSGGTGGGGGGSGGTSSSGGAQTIGGTGGSGVNTSNGGAGGTSYYAYGNSGAVGGGSGGTAGSGGYHTGGGGGGGGGRSNGGTGGSGGSGGFNTGGGGGGGGGYNSTGGAGGAGGGDSNYFHLNGGTGGSGGTGGGGGGGGSGNNGGSGCAGGGGGGGYVVSKSINLLNNASSVPITIGSGGTGGGPYNNNNSDSFGGTGGSGLCIISYYVKANA